MKKMIFSAVALVAFSFAGMANEIEDKKLIDETVLTDCDQCNQWADGQVVGQDPTNSQWMDFVDYCYDQNNCDNPRFRDTVKKKKLSIE